MNLYLDAFVFFGATGDLATFSRLYVHLMITEPERYMADFVRAGANSLSVDVEACPHLFRTIQEIRLEKD